MTKEEVYFKAEEIASDYFNSVMGLEYNDYRNDELLAECLDFFIHEKMHKSLDEYFVPKSLMAWVIDYSIKCVELKDPTHVCMMCNCN